MADPNKIRLSPIDYNQIVVDGNSIHLECDPFLPNEWTPPPGVTPIGGSDSKPKTGGSGTPTTVGGSDVKAVLDKPQSTTG